MQAVQALPASFGSSLRPVSTSNGAGSRAAGSRGPWSSAELATRPVRKGPPKPKGNAPDSRKTRTSNHRIPGGGKGLIYLSKSTFFQRVSQYALVGSVVKYTQDRLGGAIARDSGGQMT